ncbi:Gfo/Idh/MocA family oxidoreductase [Rugosimonospora africana]|uniref:Dehydrogenase n=1 Tax=Rugosimonospora africana TaxID=556532 RepID=A0A8J3QP89_9ACTN|nr:Gfo/Idh/MocA family oxidoreductase [Rugosimonospora africana]GIH14056.1 dehydrogenase [Rugosimonospora africana]
MSAPVRTAIVGTGSRAQLFTEGLAKRDEYLVVALCDRNPTRMAFHNQILTAAGRPAAATWPPERFAEMLSEARIGLLVVTTVDATHDAYIVAALEAGVRVITEKPMTTDADKARRILDTVARTAGDLTVAFNYRFNPVHQRVRQLLADGEIGELTSVHFEWLLDVRHGADYFRRWHRDKANSGGLMVHKAGHHFDLVNWWLGAAPRVVFGQGRLAFYGPEAGRRHGYARDYQRAHGSPEAQDDPFALHLDDNPTLRALYLDAEEHDGYYRDRNVFADGVTIEDDMAVLVGYDTGASMSYHLTAYSPWEGYRVMFNGSRGRVELEVEESTWTRPHERVESGRGQVHGHLAAPTAGQTRITLRPLWAPPVDMTVDHDHAGHGGADSRLLATLLDGDASQAADRASARDGALALVTGLAANRSFVTGEAVPTASVLDID